MRDLIQYAIPGFIILLVTEVIITAKQQKDYYDAKDTASSLAMGIGNVIIGFVGKLIVFGTYSLVYKFRLFTIDMAQWWAWVALFFADDISYYWFHRISHSSRYFWASHVVHHSSIKYNLGTALRQTWTGNISGAFVFWIWLPLIGFSPVAVMTMQSISLLYQFWIHTEHINKFPAPIEFIFNTPSHHRVHHGSDLDYLDKNHAGILIIWDRLFGTFQNEHQRPTYGLTTNINTFNPVRIAFHEWAAIGRDVRRARSFAAAIGYIFGPPGWSHDGSRKTTKQLRSEQATESV
ncbi:sterol desaturase family protein [Spirosoma sp. BT702]|uniref:Sterol desaturase family protein n=1 Tax=Spirosoma profusum TaxID=2771354 RepID=A0A926XYL6_9BACT|nr:sterol desaturase family protein [Spirosoma profusum]MBD2703268.1 sterol desaturase family protein [Spirosoma profusum]